MDRFPVLDDERYSVPWESIAGFEAQAWRNHGQTLETLASRGGLSSCELVALITGGRWSPMPEHQARALVFELLNLDAAVKDEAP